MCKIICTIGPASRDVDTLCQMIGTGVTIFRLNFSHGDHQYHKQSVELIREAIAKTKANHVRIALDTKGPEIRTGLLEGGPTAEVELKSGDVVTITTDKLYEKKGTASLIFVDYETLPAEVQKGTRIYVDDGHIALIVEDMGKDYVTTRVEFGGKLGSKKGVNLPDTPVQLPDITDKDREDINFAMKHNLDLIFCSFVRSSATIQTVRDLIGNQNIQVYAKVESKSGMDNIDEIIQTSDGVMVARGDLGIEIPIEKVFAAQKLIVEKCKRMNKPSIVATQMLESMIEKPRPTRAEVTDVIQAVVDGASYTMLSGETAKGRYALQTVRTMAKLITEAEEFKKCITTPPSYSF